MPEWVNVLIRSVCVLVGLFFILKILGKKQLSELSFFETIVGISIGDIAATLSMDIDLSIAEGVTAMIVWAMVPFFIDYLSLNNKRFRDYVQGKSTVFIKNGNILERNLKKEKITTDEFMEMLRKESVFRVADVEFATFEPNGELNVLLKREHQPLTYGDVYSTNLHVSEPQVLIMDGRILEESLTAIGRDKAWLNHKLKHLKAKPEDIFLAQIDSSGQLHVDLYDDNLQSHTLQDPKLLLASMKKCIAELEILCLQTQNQTPPKNYRERTIELEHLIQKLEKQLL